MHLMSYSILSSPSLFSLSMRSFRFCLAFLFLTTVVYSQDTIEIDPDREREGFIDEIDAGTSVTYTVTLDATELFAVLLVNETMADFSVEVAALNGSAPFESRLEAGLSLRSGLAIKTDYQYITLDPVNMSPVCGQLVNSTSHLDLSTPQIPGSESLDPRMCNLLIKIRAP
eukprot:409617_1